MFCQTLRLTALSPFFFIFNSYKGALVFIACLTCVRAGHFPSHTTLFENNSEKAHEL